MLLFILFSLYSLSSKEGPRSSLKRERARVRFKLF